MEPEVGGSSPPTCTIRFGSAMDRPANPFPLPATLERDLAAVEAAWRALRRAQNDIPFADDLKPGPPVPTARRA